MGDGAAVRSGVSGGACQAGSCGEGAGGVDRGEEMTTIAYDGAALACDSRSTTSFIDRRGAPKIKRIEGGVWDGYLAGWSGETAVAQSLLRVIAGGREKHIKPDVAEVLLCKGIHVVWFDENLEPVECGIPHAIGSGADFAMGAMLAGADAEKAVEIAIELDPNSNGEVFSLVPSDA